MAVMAGDLVTRLGVDGRGFQRGLQNARGEMRSFVSDVAKIASGLALFDVGKSVVGGVKDLAVASVNLAADAETAAVQFRVLTGSAESAAEVMKDINKFAAATPFESMEITQAAKQLLAFGGSASTVISELQTLGDLSAGMGIPLGELAELYGKARIQGRLFMEDINQLQGRGINVTAELAKEFGNVRDAVEKGQVNFGHLEKALKAMTTEGGGFFGMMMQMSTTFQGQVSTLVDNIKAIGRELGQAVLPKLTEMVSFGNQILQKFNEMPDKAKYVADVFEASMDVAFELIKTKWDDMLKSMVRSAIKIDWMRLIDPVSGNLDDAARAMLKNKEGAGDLGKAQNRLNDLLNKVNPNAPPANPNAGFEWQGPREQGFAAAILRKMKPASGDVKGALSGLFDAIGKDPIVDAFKGGVGGMLDRALLQFDAIKGTLANWLGTDAADASKPESQLAGAMQQGSQEAYSTLVQNMLSRTTDPVVKATKEQTKELIKAWAKQPAQNNKVALMAAPGSP
jgi:hypothetical protein